MTSSSRITPDGHLGPPSDMPTPQYVHHLLDSLINGTPLDFHGQAVPDDVMTRLVVAVDEGKLKQGAHDVNTLGAGQSQAPSCEHGFTVYRGLHPNGKPCPNLAEIMEDRRDADRLLAEALARHDMPAPPKYKFKSMLSIMLNEVMSEQTKYKMALDIAKSLSTVEAVRFARTLDRMREMLTARMAINFLTMMPALAESLRKTHPEAFGEDGEIDMAKLAEKEEKEVTSDDGSTAAGSAGGADAAGSAVQS